MNFLYPLASVFGIEAGELAERLKKNAILWGFIAVFGFVAFAFLLVAAHNGLALWVGPIASPLIIAGAAALVALTLFLVSSVTADIAHRQEVQRRRSAEKTALVTTAAITAVPLLLRTPLLKTIGLPLGGALAALYLLSKSGGNSDDDAAG
jgi:heme/copper-type cytochrome/quinol oxidase subunit 3